MSINQLFPKVSALWVYPLKSGQGHNVQSTELMQYGLAHDRRWMLIDAETGEQFTQRDRYGEKLVFMKTQFQELRDDGETSALFQAPGMDLLSVLNPNLHNARDKAAVILHGKELEALDGGGEAAAWFSKYLDRKVRLVRFPNDYRRALKPQFYNPDDHTAYADAGPVLITNTASLESLRPHFNAKATNIDMRRFRPNIVIEGLAPWEEDVTLIVRIGDAVLQITKPCDRCGVPSVDPDTGKRGKEPGRTLVEQRMGEGGGLSGMFFGQNAKPIMFGKIHIGDRVEILERQKMHVTLEKCVLKFAA